MFGRCSYWANPKDLERAEELSKVKTDLIVIDAAHGNTQKVLNMIRKIKKKLKNCTLCAGNIATGKAAKFLADSGVDIVKVGICPGSICMTRLVAGIGVPQSSAAAIIIDGKIIAAAQEESFTRKKIAIDLALVFVNLFPHLL